MLYRQFHGTVPAWGVLRLSCLLLCAAVAPVGGASTTSTNSVTNSGAASLLKSNALSTTNSTNLAGMPGGTNGPAQRAVSGWGKKL